MSKKEEVLHIYTEDGTLHGDVVDYVEASEVKAAATPPGLREWVLRKPHRRRRNRSEREGLRS
jgi:hypothetical protein